jgi:DNA invertase Pin-like site-specific DNA recombinase
MKGHVVGYIRVSSYGQNTDRQLPEVVLDKIFEEKASAKDTNRPVLQKQAQKIPTGPSCRTVLITSVKVTSCTSIP